MHDSQPPHDLGTPCTAFRAFFDDIAAEATDAVTVARVEAHAEHCPPCRFALATARAYRHAMRRVGTAVRASDRLRERVLDSLREVRGSRQS
jgi:hypothetical protein